MATVKQLVGIWLWTKPHDFEAYCAVPDKFDFCFNRSQVSLKGFYFSFVILNGLMTFSSLVGRMYFWVLILLLLKLDMSVHTSNHSTWEV